MKGNFFLLILISFVTLGVNAQSNELIIGNWVFKDAFNKEKISDAELEMFKNEMISKMTLNFSDDGKFNGYAMGKNQSGTWKLSEDSKKITLVDDEANAAEFNILKLTNEELAIKFGIGEFLMVRKVKKE
ncbi:lipocalin family protein [Aureibaculum sp. 2210JD6-5]|uniref:lipocalin family protein n=1 Tax=Aureibaculum sp. 2210JD6-5 TaxID=3103957 RepID=UPI002AACD454|nr:lipocalin family protein [Aureibaculum sp. 2210JD6-5]MDY7393642.1 lipocalin family protein [Aureibaculum sp. 2210JD6-5]